MATKGLLCDSRLAGVCDRARRVELSKSAERGLTGMTWVSYQCGESKVGFSTTCYLNTRRRSQQEITRTTMFAHSIEAWYSRTGHFTRISVAAVTFTVRQSIKLGVQAQAMPDQRSTFRQRHETETMSNVPTYIHNYPASRF